jgi:hypothetical protein
MTVDESSNKVLAVEVVFIVEGMGFVSLMGSRLPIP